MNEEATMACGAEAGRAEADLGVGLRGSRAGLALAAAVGAAVLVVDLWAAGYGRLVFPLRVGTAVAVAVLYACLSGWDWRAVGLGLRPARGWGHWARLSGKVAAVAFALLVAGLQVRVGGQWPQVAGDWGRPLFRKVGEFGPWALQACVPTPLAEEGIYRLVLCVPVAAALGRRWAVALSGVVFAALHVAYGNPALDNVLAGFILGWAFVESRSLVVPIAWHAGGNLLVGLYHLALWALEVG